MKPKNKDDRYNNLFGPWVQYIMYGFKQCAENKPKHIVICEGPFDALRLWEYGYSAMALMGIALKKGQKDMLSKTFKNDCNITVLLDESEFPSAQLVGAGLYTKFNSVKIGSLTNNKDPGESTEEEVFNAIINANKA